METFSKSEVFFTSDFHFFHKNIVAYCHRPWTAEENTQALISIWNNCVSENDTVFHLGDLALYRDPVKAQESVSEVLSQLKGNIHLIMGNHDQPLLMQSLYDSCDNVMSVSYYKEIAVDGQHIVLFHYPIASWNGRHRGSWHLFGHTHGKFMEEGNSMDVGIDNSIRVLGEYRLFSYRNLEYAMGVSH